LPAPPPWIPSELAAAIGLANSEAARLNAERAAIDTATTELETAPVENAAAVIKHCRDLAQRRLLLAASEVHLGELRAGLFEPIQAVCSARSMAYARDAEARAKVITEQLHALGILDLNAQAQALLHDGEYQALSRESDMAPLVARGYLTTGDETVHAKQRRAALVRTAKGE